ncbi:hypothetical protein [Pseudonocardia sp.]|uniref:thermonuclease family protein n=1 Tax=Pseudonocardia sp. TaxID=60912 RepID=UPI002627829C|nr:hypothetical protein [Pseudonocardia sp.]
MGVGKLVWGGVAVVLVIGACNNLGEDQDGPVGPASREAAAAAASLAPTPSEPSASTPGAARSGGSTAAVVSTAVIASVFDGDTFRMTDGQVVRVLGINSCEMTTHSGRQARADALRLLPVGKPVGLRNEPGVDRDSYGRHLRYVTTTNGLDFGTSMIRFDHTEVYEGGDAAATYTAQLRRLDEGPRVCTRRTPATSTNPAPSTTATTPGPKAAPDPPVRRAPDPPRRPAPEPAPVVEPEPVEQNCHPSYTPCVPDGPDLDCGDIRKLVIVSGPDEFRLDGDDNDGRGCESYG